MTRQNNLCFQFGDTSHSGIEVVDFKPQEYAVAIRLVIGITDWPVVVSDLKTVQLEDEHTMRNQSLIDRTTVCAPTAQQALIPLAARFDIGHRDEGLRTHPYLRLPNLLLA
jgi:hypothetical protein